MASTFTFPSLLLFFFAAAAATATTAAAGSKIGWETFLTSELSEWHDVPLTWRHSKNASSAIPSWVKGQFVRNGPARLDFGGKRHYTMYMDGWGKLHSFKIDGEKVLSSGKLTETKLYERNVAAGDILPAITLAPVGPNDWSALESITALTAGFDNTNTHVWRYGPPVKTEAQYAAITDYPTQTMFDVDTLEVKRVVVPRGSWGSCAHPVREPGTENSINYRIAADWLFRPNTFEVRRYSTFDESKLITKFKPKKLSYIHSFSVTENFAVFFFAPLTMDFTFVLKGGHPLTSLKWDPTEPTDIYIVDLKTGAVDTSSTLPFFAAHHVNAFETKDAVDGRTTGIVVDVCQTAPDGLGHYMELEKMRAAEPLTGKGTSVLRRFAINLDTKITTMTTPRPKPSTLPEYVSQFDFPTINEKYRGRRYCFAWGVVAVDYADYSLVKKSRCDEDGNSEDKVYRAENHYFGEATFVPNPAAVAEDDGVLVTIGFDGVAEKSYLLVLDAATMEPINQAFVPHRIPYSFHGNFFEEAWGS